MSERVATEKELQEAIQEAIKRHVKRGDSLIPPYATVQITDDIPVFRLGKMLPKGLYQLSVNDSGGNVMKMFLHTVRFDLSELNESIRDLIERGDAREVTDAASGMVTTESDSPLEFKATLEPIRFGDEGPLSIGLLMIWAAIADAEKDGDVEKAHALFRAAYGIDDRKETRRGRKPETVNDHVVMTTTKVEKGIFGDVEKPVPAEFYDGREIGVKLGRLGTTTLALKTDKPVNLMDASELAEAQLSSVDRFWLTALQSCVHDNPEKTRFYGSDLMKRYGYKKPLRPDHAETMKEAARSITSLTHMSMWLDTTQEAIRYEKKGRVVQRITDRKIVNGEVSMEAYDDGTTDFFVDLFPVAGGQASSALPLLEYARQKKELITADQNVFDFSGCGTVTTEHRRAMDYIYRQISSEGLSNNIVLSTLMKRTDIKDTKDTRYRLCKKLEILLNNWVKRGIIVSWCWTYKGRSRHGLQVKPKPRKRYEPAI